MFKVRALLINTYLACFDLAISAACCLALLHWDLGLADGALRWRALPAASPSPGLIGVLATWLALLLYFGMYQSRRMDSVFADLRILAKAALTCFVLLEAYAHFMPGSQRHSLFSFRFVVVNFLALSLARIAIRLILREFRRQGYNTKNLLVVASPELGARLCKKLEQRSHYGYRILGCLEYGKEDARSSSELLQEFRDVLHLKAVDDVILALPVQAYDLTARLVEECESRGINVRLVPDLFPLIQSETQVYDLDGLPLINVHLYPTEYFGYVFLKRALDVVASLTILVLASPLFVLIAVLVKLTSPGPILVVQERVGLNGRRFKMLKFRTMHPRETQDAGTHWTTRNDPNVTPLGRWLRRSNLDELPQFLNVLKGDMSIVGPRPERPFFIERFRREIPDYMLRHYVKCGITGWAQVNGWRGDTSIRERLAHDLYYMQNWALSLDLKILFLTVTRSFFHRNAY